MKKMFLLWVMLSMGSLSAFSQVVKLINGAVVTWLDDNYQVYDKNRGFYTGGIGVDYLEYNYFYLSSELVYKPRGGKSLLTLPGEAGIATNEYVKGRVDYLQINTTARFKYEYSDLHFYAGIGPKIDIRLGTHADEDRIINGTGEPVSLIHKDKLKSVVWGIKPELGVFYDIEPFRIDLNFAWIVDFTRIGTSKQEDVRSGAFSATLGLGYRF